MAYIVIINEENKIHKIVFKNLTVETARIIADRMNKLNTLVAKQTGKVIKLVYKVVGK